MFNTKRYVHILVLATTPGGLVAVKATGRQCDAPVSPEQALACVQEAFARRDPTAIAEATYNAGSEGILAHEAKIGGARAFLETEESRIFGSLLSRLKTRGVVPMPAPAVSSSSEPTFTEAVRLLCTFANSAEHHGLFPPERQHVVALTFVKHEGRWKWYGDAYTTWRTWSYASSTPEEACRSVVRAIEEMDITGVFQMIDSQMLRSTQRREFLRGARERLQAIAAWRAAEKAARQKARRAGVTRPRRTAPPFLAFDPHWVSTSLAVEQVREGGAQVARVWRLGPSRDRVAYETFVRQGDQWRWRPKKEYTAWPVRYDESPERR